jgi:hypothetical protein
MNPRNRGSRLMRDGAPAPAERDLLRSLAHRDLGLPFVVFLPAIHGLFHGASEGHGSCIDVAVSAEKRRHRPGCSQTRSELDQIPDRLDRRGGRERLLQRPDAGDVGVFAGDACSGVTLVSPRRGASRTVSCSTRSRPRRGASRTATTGSRRRAAPGGAPSSSSRCAHCATSVVAGASHVIPRACCSRPSLAST